MNAIVLWVESGGWDPNSWFHENHGEITADGRVVVYSSGEWISIDRGANVLGCYEESERDRISSCLTDAHACMIQWRGEAVANEFFSSIPEDAVAIVDNDHGLICRVEMIRNLPVGSWAYRKSL